MTSRQSVNAAHILGDAFRVYSEHASVVVSASVILQFVDLVLSYLLLNQFGPGLGIALGGILSLVVAGITTGVYTLLLLHLRWGHDRPNVGYLLKSAMPFALPLLWLSILTAIGTGIGFLFLFIPGIILSLLWAVAAPALVVERIGALEALSRSRAISRDAWGSVAVITIFQGAIGIGIPQIASAMGEQMVLEDLLLAQAVITALIAPIGAIALAELYLRLSNYQAVEQTLPTGPFVPGMPVAAAGPQVPGIPGATAYVAQQAQAHAQPPAYGAPVAQHQPYAAAPQPPAYGAPLTPQPCDVPPAYGAPAQPQYAQAPPAYGAPAQPQYPQAPPAYAPPAPPQHQPYAAPAAPAPPTYAAPAAPAQPAYPQPPAAPAPQIPAVTRTHSVPPPGLG